MLYTRFSQYIFKELKIIQWHFKTLRKKANEKIKKSLN